VTEESIQSLKQVLRIFFVLIFLLVSWSVSGEDSIERKFTFKMAKISSKLPTAALRGGPAKGMTSMIGSATNAT